MLPASADVANPAPQERDATADAGAVPINQKNPERNTYA